jgi:hypothetical protein
LFPYTRGPAGTCRKRWAERSQIVDRRGIGRGGVPGNNILAVLYCGSVANCHTGVLFVFKNAFCEFAVIRSESRANRKRVRQRDRFWRRWRAKRRTIFSFACKKGFLRGKWAKSARCGSGCAKGIAGAGSSQLWRRLCQLPVDLGTIFRSGIASVEWRFRLFFGVANRPGAMPRLALRPRRWREKDARTLRKHGPCQNVRFFTKPTFVRVKKTAATGRASSERWRFALRSRRFACRWGGQMRRGKNRGGASA